MKKYLTVLLAALATLCAKAGDGDGLLNVNAGYLYPNTLNATIGYEREFGYGQAAEIFGEAGNHWQHPTCHRFWKGYYWDGGILYKYRLKRYKNGMLRFRIGPQFGAELRQFFIGVEAGFEYCYVFPSGIQLSVVQKNNFNFLNSGGDHFRNGLLIGLKFPL